MNYLVAVLPDRIQAEAAYSALEKKTCQWSKWQYWAGAIKLLMNMA